MHLLNEIAGKAPFRQFHKTRGIQHKRHHGPVKEHDEWK